jgi:hypothetical protein
MLKLSTVYGLYFTVMDLLALTFEFLTTLTLKGVG